MTRVRFDPAFIDDPRWERLGVDAYVLHVAACSFVVRNLTDGHITAGRVGTLTPLVADPHDIAQRCVNDGLWQLEGDGYHVCDCIDDLRTAVGRGDEQPSKAFVEGERARSRDRKARWRAKSAEGNAVPNGSQSSGIAVQAPPSPALHSGLDVENGEWNGVPESEDAELAPCPPELAEAVRTAHRHRQVAKARGVA